MLVEIGTSRGSSLRLPQESVFLAYGDDTLAGVHSARALRPIGPPGGSHVPRSCSHPYAGRDLGWVKSPDPRSRGKIKRDEQKHKEDQPCVQEGECRADGYESYLKNSRT